MKSSARNQRVIVVILRCCDLMWVVFSGFIMELLGDMFYILVLTTIGSAVNVRGDRSYDMRLPGMFLRSFLNLGRWVMAY